MSLRHAMLGLLTLAPSNGYELTRRFDQSLRNAWHASHSQIYPELAKLEQEREEPAQRGLVALGAVRALLEHPASHFGAP